LEKGEFGIILKSEFCVLVFGGMVRLESFSFSDIIQLSMVQKINMSVFK